MGRNRLSADDRIKNQFKPAEKWISDYINGDSKILVKQMKTIRSITLRSLILFSLMQIDEFNFMINHSPKVISDSLYKKGIKIGERKVYDLIKTIRLLQQIDDIAFNKMQSEFAKK